MSLTLEGVGKRVGAEEHLFPLTLTLPPGLNVLLGPTLAGKTSLMRLIAGLDRPSEGRVLLDGRDVTLEPVQRRSVAFVYQQFVNYPNFTVFDNVASPLKILGTPAAEVRRRVGAVAELMHLTPMLGRLPAQLSGGQQQRVAIARALVKEARLLLFDEPLVNLDYKLREELRAEMREIFTRSGAVVVYSTTEPLEALTLGGHVAVLAEGRLIQAGSTLEVYHHPASQRVGEVFSDPPMNLLEASLGGGEASFLGGRFPLPLHLRALPDGPYQIGVRANHVTLNPLTSGDITFQARIELAELSGSETYLHTRAGPSRVVGQLEGIHSLELGQDLTLHLDPRRLFAFGEGGRLAAAPPRAQAGVA